jgi:hypothetical protein
VDRFPADSGLSYPVQQDQWLARPGPMTGEIVGGGRGQGGRDDVSSVGWTASEHRNLSNSRGGPHYSPGGACGWPVTRASRCSEISSARHGSCRDLPALITQPKYERALPGARARHATWSTPSPVVPAAVVGRVPDDPGSAGQARVQLACNLAGTRRDCPRHRRDCPTPLKEPARSQRATRSPVKNGCRPGWASVTGGLDSV